MVSGSSLDFKAARLESVLHAMELEAKTSIIFLDACRDNPLARSLARSIEGTGGLETPRGLARVRAAIGMLVSFSTQPGYVAGDGEGRNSPYTAALARHLEDSDSLSDILIKVRSDVVAATQEQQVPWEHSALRAKFYFKSHGRVNHRQRAHREPTVRKKAPIALSYPQNSGNSKGRDCTPYNGPYGYYSNPWCDGGFQP